MAHQHQHHSYLVSSLGLHAFKFTETPSRLLPHHQQEFHWEEDRLGVRMRVNEQGPVHRLEMLEATL